MTAASSKARASGLIIVNHNTKDDLLACLETARSAGADHVVVVDCGSRDGSLEAVAKHSPDAVQLALPNLGFGRGVNAGVERLKAVCLAAGQPCDVIVVANADTRLEPDGVAALAGYLRDNLDVGAVGPRVVFPDGRLQYSARSFPDIPTALGHALFGLVLPTNRWTRRYRLTDWDHESPRDVDWLSGCCVAFSAAAFEDADGFDPAYFMFVEDVDLCWRLGQLGWRVSFAPVTQVTHAIGASVGTRRTRMVFEHARSLDRFFDRRYNPGLLTKTMIRGGLTAWALSVIVWSKMQGRTHAQAA